MSPVTSHRERPLQRVGIVLAAYQPQQQLFEGQLESIRTQDHPDWFCVVTMDSPLLTLEEAPWIRRFYEDPRFHFYENPTRLGVRENFERGSHLALDLGAEAIAFSDQDDLWYPTKVSCSLAALNRQPPSSVVSCDARVRLDGVLQPHLRSRYEGYARVKSLSPRRILLTWAASGNGMIFDADLVRRYPFKMSGQSFHDGHISAVAILSGGITFIRDVLFEYNLHQTNVVGLSSLRAEAQTQKSREKRKRLLLLQRVSPSRESSRSFLQKWIGSKRLLRDTGWRFAPLRFLLSTYVGMMALLAFLLFEGKFRNRGGSSGHGVRHNVKVGLWFFRRWIIPRMRIYALVFNRP